MNNEMSDMKRYPEPNFPAPSAWKSMQEILDKEIPVNNNRKKRFAFLWLITLLFGGMGFYLLSNLSSNNKIAVSNRNALIKQTEIVTHNSINLNKPFAENKTKYLAIKAQTNSNEIPHKLLDSTKKNIPENKTNNTSKTSSNKTISTDFFNNKETNDNYSISTPQINILKQIADTYYGRTSLKQNFNVEAKSSIVFNNISTEKINAETKTASVGTLQIATGNNNLSITKAVVKVPKNTQRNSLHYGLQWNILLPQSNSYLDYKAKNQPLSILIPEFWISKDLSRKSELALQLNPYSQYTIRNNNTLVTEDYPLTIYQGSNPTPTIVHYNRTRSLLKAMGLELTAKYTYHLNNKFSIAVGIGNNWLNAAVVNDKIVSKDGKNTKDSVYGIAKGFSDWNYINSSFAVGRIEMLYQFNKLEIGVAFLKPLNNIYSFLNTSSSPINGRVVLRWKIR